MTESKLYCIVRIIDGWCGWDHNIEETIIKVYRTKEEAEKNLPKNSREYAGGTEYNSFYNYITYEVREYE